MKRTITAIIILLLVFSMWFFERRIIDSTCIEIDEAVEILKRAIEEESDATEKNEDFIKKWERAEKRFDALMPHEDADEIKLLSIRLTRDIEIGDYNSALTVAEEIKWHIKDIMEKTRVDITTVF